MAAKRKIKHKARKKRGGRLQGKAQDPTQVALILSFAAKDGQAAACKRFGVADRTVRRYKHRVENGDWPEVAELLKTMRNEAMERCKDLLTEAYEVSLRRMIELVPNADLPQAIKAAEMCGGLKLTKDALGEPDSTTGAGSPA